ncbi:sorting nexin-31 isoform X2 [Spea bombifrons]|uniref:sorting nexin-31 isoform X2 n=1 Tax=Spea bombifrons TaxID=233779 RepID=UPI00234B3D72|nr:sorting nexin-31 isoform X2 [Spea bombifrons]
MHINIPVTEDLQDSLGVRFVLYSVYLEGFLIFKARYKDLHLWNEQLHHLFGNQLPNFPPKYFLAMTKAMAEERRLQLERYLQKLVSDPVVSGSEKFMEFFKKSQLDTFKMSSVKIILNVYLPDGQHVKVDAYTSDTAERVLEAALYKLRLSRELKEYFSLFITRRERDTNITVVKQITGFELPFITIWNMPDDTFQIDIRKWYLNPFTDSMLLGCTAAISLLYMQAVQEFQMNWSRPTEEQRKKLQHLIETGNQLKFLELMQKVEHYGYLQLHSCTSDYPEPGTSVTVSVGNFELCCCFQPPKGQAELIQLHVADMTCWHVQMLHSAKGDSARQSYHLEFTLEYIQGETQKCVTIRTQQAFLLSSCLKKMVCEQPVTSIKEALEIAEKTRTISNKSSKKSEKVRAHMKKGHFLSTKEENVIFDGFTDLNL